MEVVAIEGTRNRAVGADKRHIEAQHFCDWKRKRVATTRDECYLDSQFVRTAQGGDIGCRNLELRVEQGAIDIDGDKTDGRSHWTDFISLAPIGSREPVVSEIDDQGTAALTVLEAKDDAPSREQLVLAGIRAWEQIGASGVIVADLAAEAEIRENLHFETSSKVKGSGICRGRGGKRVAALAEMRESAADCQIGRDRRAGREFKSNTGSHEHGGISAKRQ
jgi:hypothetical protein